MQLSVPTKELVKALQICLMAAKKGTRPLFFQTTDKGVRVMGTDGHWAATYYVVRQTSVSPSHAFAMTQDIAKLLIKTFKGAKDKDTSAVDFASNSVAGTHCGVSNADFPWNDVDRLSMTSSATPGEHIGVSVEYMQDVANAFKIAGATAIRFEFTGYKSALKISDTMDPDGPLSVLFMPVETLPAPVATAEKITLENRLNVFAKEASVPCTLSGAAKIARTQKLMQEAALLESILASTIVTVQERAVIVSAAFKSALEG